MRPLFCLAMMMMMIHILAIIATRHVSSDRRQVYMSLDLLVFVLFAPLIIMNKNEKIARLYEMTPNSVK